jgi:hypothetical protein
MANWLLRYVNPTLYESVDKEPVGPCFAMTLDPDGRFTIAVNEAPNPAAPDATHWPTAAEVKRNPPKENYENFWKALEVPGGITATWTFNRALTGQLDTYPHGRFLEPATPGAPKRFTTFAVLQSWNGEASATLRQGQREIGKVVCKTTLGKSASWSAPLLGYKALWGGGGCELHEAAHPPLGGDGTLVKGGSLNPVVWSPPATGWIMGGFTYPAVRIKKDNALVCCQDRPGGGFRWAADTCKTPAHYNACYVALPRPSRVE